MMDVVSVDVLILAVVLVSAVVVEGMEVPDLVPIFLRYAILLLIFILE